MGILFNRSNEDEDDNCSHHHWGAPYLCWDSFVTVRDYGEKLKISVSRRKDCQHEGCDATDREGDETYNVPKAALCAHYATKREDYMTALLDGATGDELAALQRLCDLANSQPSSTEAALTKAAQVAHDNGDEEVSDELTSIATLLADE